MPVEILTKSEVNNADRVLLDKLDLAIKRISDLEAALGDLAEHDAALLGRIEVLEEAVQALGRGEPLPPIDGSGPVGPPVVDGRLEVDELHVKGRLSVGGVSDFRGNVVVRVLDDEGRDLGGCVIAGNQLCAIGNRDTPEVRLATNDPIEAALGKVSYNALSADVRTFFERVLAGVPPSTMMLELVIASAATVDREKDRKGGHFQVRVRDSRVRDDDDGQRLVASFGGDYTGDGEPIGRIKGANGLGQLADNTRHDTDPLALPDVRRPDDRPDKGSGGGGSGSGSGGPDMFVENLELHGDGWWRPPNNEEALKRDVRLLKTVTLTGQVIRVRRTATGGVAPDVYVEFPDRSDNRRIYHVQPDPGVELALPNTGKTERVLVDCHAHEGTCEIHDF